MIRIDHNDSIPWRCQSQTALIAAGDDGKTCTPGHKCGCLQASPHWRWNFAAKLAQGRINGTKIQRERLPKRTGDLAKLAAHLLGRQPSDDELAAAKASKNPIGLLLASPSFQWS